MNEKTIVTHNGNFHADDVFSFAALKCIFPSVKLIRTRDGEQISKADIVIDVGGEYNPDAGRFDHHQRGGAGQRENGIPYSSFGLVWLKYGLEICQGRQDVADAVDAELVSAIDAIDCGHVEGIYNGISLSHTIAMFNPTWQEEDSHLDTCFNKAADFASHILARFMTSAIGEINAKDIVAKAIDNADDPRVIVLEKYIPWKETVLTSAPKALFIIYPSQSGKWIVHAVPVELGSFDDRKSLPKQWAGLSDAELRDLTGIDDIMFCHNGLFIAGAKSLESTKKMALMALQA